MRGSKPLAAPALNRYALYKAGTSKLLTWLLDTSADCGFGDPKNPPKSPVPVSRLLSCAQTISAKEPTVHIPYNIVELSIDVIHGRELCAELYAGTEKEDKSHRYFIDVLVEVVTLLKAVRKRYISENVKPSDRNISRESDISIESATSSDHENVANRFTNFEVEEPSDKSFSTPEKRNHKKSPQNQTCWPHHVRNSARWRWYATLKTSSNCAFTSDDCGRPMPLIA